MAIELRYTLREEEFREGFGAAAKEEPWELRWILAPFVIVVAIGFAVGVGMLGGLIYPNKYVEMGCGLAGLFFVSRGMRWVRKGIFRQTWRKQVADQIVMLEEEFILKESGGNSVRIPWVNVKGWMNTGRTMVIRTTAGVIVVSKREMTPERVGEVGGFLGRKVAGVGVPPVVGR